MADTNETLVIEDASESFATWANQSFILPETRQSILKSNLLIVPWVGFRSLQMPVFPVCTERLFQFLKENATHEVIPEICIEDKDYKEVALHSALLIVGAFVVTALVAPIATDLISEYIKRTMFKHDENKIENAKRKVLNEKEDCPQVRVELTVVEENGKALKFHYEGPAEDFRKTINAALKAPAKINNSNLPEKLKSPPSS